VNEHIVQPTTNFLLAGVGGQGILLAADVLSLVGMEIAWDVKKSEVHGMAQRGGSVTSHVRWGTQVASPLITPGEVDYFLAFERVEALRYAGMLRPTGTLLINDYRISPVSVSSGSDNYPAEADEARVYAGALQHPIYVPAMRLAQELGQARANNVVLLGALAALLDVPEQVWLRVIAGRVPERFVALNQQAFAAGRAFMTAAQ
jgi:indolepyruvate ferredoxin oxidoreductase, beta subunit